MRKEFCLIDAGHVVNIIAGDENTDPELYAHHDAIVEIPLRPDIGWKWDGKVFTPAEMPQPVHAVLEQHEARDIMKALVESGLGPKRIQQIAKKLVMVSAIPKPTEPPEVPEAPEVLELEPEPSPE
jgi:hypothetical protein